MHETPNFLYPLTIIIYKKWTWTRSTRARRVLPLSHLNLFIFFLYLTCHNCWRSTLHRNETNRATCHVSRSWEGPSSLFFHSLLPSLFLSNYLTISVGSKWTLWACEVDRSWEGPRSLELGVFFFFFPLSSLSLFFLFVCLFVSLSYRKLVKLVHV